MCRYKLSWHGTQPRHRGFTRIWIPSKTSLRLPGRGTWLGLITTVIVTTMYWYIQGGRVASWRWCRRWGPWYWWSVFDFLFLISCFLSFLNLSWSTPSGSMSNNTLFRCNPNHSCSHWRSSATCTGPVHCSVGVRRVLTSSFLLMCNTVLGSTS